MDVAKPKKTRKHCRLHEQYSILTVIGATAPTRRTMMDSGARSTSIVKHSLLIAGHRTSVSLEDAFWSALRADASTRNMSVAALVTDIDASRGDANLSSAIRVYLLETTRAAAKSAGSYVS